LSCPAPIVCCCLQDKYEKKDSYYKPEYKEEPKYEDKYSKYEKKYDDKYEKKDEYYKKPEYKTEVGLRVSTCRIQSGLPLLLGWEGGRSLAQCLFCLRGGRGIGKGMRL
jgi:hypothetical protein